ncbi:hypothetical protein [Halobaculum rarum]|uniref:hypothetical protein n=1 Tax=Halobaculum rarum TaxID=3075122 RepID=UPI0032B018E4
MSGRDDGGDGDGDPDRADDAADTSYDPDTRAAGHPIDPNALMIAAATASVGAGRLPELLRAADEHLRARREEYDRSYECVDEADDADDTGTATYLVPDGHWSEIGDELGLKRRETDALRRAHEQHLLRLGTKRRRRREFESALELREAVVIGG